MAKNNRRIYNKTSEKKVSRARRSSVVRISSLLLSIIGILMMIVSIISLILGLIVTFGAASLNILSNNFFSTISSVGTLLILFSLIGIIFGYIFRLSGKWVGSNDINGAILGTLLSITFLVPMLFVSFSVSASPFSYVLYVFSALLLFSMVSSLASVLRTEKHRSLAFGFIPLIVGLILAFALAFMVRLMNPQAYSLASALTAGSFYQLVPTTQSFSSQYANYSYPSSWEAINVNGIASSFATLAFSPKNMSGSTSVLGNNSVSVLIPDSFILSSIASSPQLVFSASDLGSLLQSNVSSNVSELVNDLNKTLPEIKQLSLIVVVNQPVNYSSLGVPEGLLNQTSGILSKLNKSSNLKLPVNLTKTVDMMASNTSSNMSYLKFLPSSVSLVNLSDNVGIEVIYSGGEVYNITKSVVPVYQISLALTQIGDRMCMVTGITFSNSTLNQFNGAFSNVVSSIDCK